MDRNEFSSLLRDALANIHDYVVLEKHALNEIVPRPDSSIRKGENLRSFICDGIYTLKPDERQAGDSLEMRYYLTLSGRYIDGLSVAELQKRLSLGERQERRIHSRAVDLLEEVLWDRLFPPGAAGAPPQEVKDARGGGPALDAGSEEGEGEDFSFPVSLEPLHLSRVLDEITALFLPQLQARGGDLSIQAPVDLPMIQADRIILRQILLQIFNRVLQSSAGEDVQVSARHESGVVQLTITAWEKPDLIPGSGDLYANQMFAYWIERLNARLRVEQLERRSLPSGAAASIHTAFTLELPAANQAKILVVDDHEPAIRIIQRFLSQTNMHAVGVSDPAQVLPLARSLQPRTILLDVMMPSIDGWEILQKLKSDPGTHRIPVIICSVWDQPDLAYSLGADAFLKKPILQVELLNELARLCRTETSGE